MEVSILSCFYKEYVYKNEKNYCPILCSKI